MVLIDAEATLHGYNSDVTRNYVFGEADERQREIWELERTAQLAAGEVTTAVGLGLDYKVPRLPHHTWHGVCLDVHEHPYIVRGNDLPLAPGMCFSIEPMICSYGEFGLRMEDHAYIADDDPRWFTQPGQSIESPFNL